MAAMRWLHYLLADSGIPEYGRGHIDSDLARRVEFGRVGVPLDLVNVTVLVVELAAHTVGALLGLEERLAVLVSLRVLLLRDCHLMRAMSEFALLFIPAEADFYPVLA